MKNPLTSYPRTFRRALVRNRIVRALLILFITWNLVELHLVLRRISETDIVYREQPRRQERIYIAMVNWNNEYILRSHLCKAITELAWKLGPENIYISIYESGSYDNTKGALVELDAELDRLNVPRNITMSYITHADEIAARPEGEGWVVTPQAKKELRRIPYLSRVRNYSLEPLHELAKRGIHFDKILFLNDVVFTVRRSTSCAPRLIAFKWHCRADLESSQATSLSSSTPMTGIMPRHARWISQNRLTTMTHLLSAMLTAMRLSCLHGRFSANRHRVTR